MDLDVTRIPVKVWSGETLTLLIILTIIVIIKTIIPEGEGSCKTAVQ